MKFYLNKMYFLSKDSNVAIIVYDITVKASFDVLKNWIKELRQYGPKNIGFILIL